MLLLMAIYLHYFVLGQIVLHINGKYYCLKMSIDLYLCVNSLGQQYVLVISGCIVVLVYPTFHQRVASQWVNQTFFWSTFFSPFKWQHGLIFSTLLLYGTWFYSSKKQLLDYFSWNSSIWLILIWLVSLLCLSQIRHSNQMSHLL